MRSLVSISSIGLSVALSGSLLFQSMQKKATPNTIFYSMATDRAADTGLAKIIRLAEAFKASLKEDQLSLLQLAYSKTDAVKWSNFPQAFSRPQRVGISMASLNPSQAALAKALMASVLSQNASNEGYDELQGIFAADDYFGKQTGQTTTFGAGNYYLAFLGKPSTTALWELQFGGHHYAFANTYNKGQVTGVTPSFRGVEPAAPVTSAGSTYQPLEGEKTAFANILAGLSDAEKAAAKLSSSFSDVLLGPGRDGQFPTAKQGIKVGSLSSAKQNQVMKAIDLYVMDLDASTAKPIAAKYRSELADTYLSFTGSGTMNSANDYVRIDGPGVWIEYSAQPSRDFPGTTHPHSVWRDHKTDYGGN